MAERIIPFTFDEYYHVYNRGNSKQVIYKNERDYMRFMQLLYLSNGTKSFKIRELGKQDLYEVNVGEPLVAIGSYCLMSNHFHILLQPLVDGGVSLFMKKLSTGYSMYFNKKYQRTGGLFEGRFKSQHVDEDNYLKYLFSYIHLNPIKLIQADWKEKGIANVEEALNYLGTYKYSSYPDWIPTGPTWGRRKESVILDKSSFPVYFDDLQTSKEEIVEWLQYD